MRASLIIFGVIFLVMGALLYFVPMQEFKANTTTTGGEDIDNRTSSASITIPTVYAYASAAIGLILLMFSFMNSNQNRRRDSRKNSYGAVVESKENIEFRDGNKNKIIRERRESHNSKRDKHDN